MPTYGYPDLKVELDNNADALQNISAWVESINGWTLEALTEELTAAGDATDRWGSVGFTSKEEVVLEGRIDTTANSLYMLTKGAEGDTRTLKLTFDGVGATDVQTVECIISKTERKPERRTITKFIVTLRPNGAVT